MSFKRVNRNSGFAFGRLFCALALLFVAQFAYASLCAPEMDPCVSQAVSTQCVAAGFSPDLCAGQVQAAVCATHAASPSYGAPGADAPYHAPANAVFTLRQGPASGLPPGLPSPVHILFGRYLS